MSGNGKHLAAMAAILLLGGSKARAQEVVAVLSSDKEPYRQAYEGFQEAFGGAVPILPLEGDAHLPKAAKVVVAFGGKAAAKRYPDRVTLIYAISPGLELDSDSHDGRRIRIPMEPEASAILASLTEIQPALKRLAILWSSEASDSSARALDAAGRAAAMAIDSERLGDSEELPVKLRGLKGRVDAIWLPADPLLINELNFETIKQYAYANGIPFYAPTAGLSGRGAAAAVSVGYREIGRTAAGAAKEVLAGGDLRGDVYARRSEISLNLTAAKAIGLAIPNGTVERASRVFP